MDGVPPSAQPNGGGIPEKVTDASWCNVRVRCTATFFAFCKASLALAQVSIRQ